MSMQHVTVTVHFGNSNWFNFKVSPHMKYGKLVSECTRIMNVEMTDVLYVLCNGKVICSDLDYNWDDRIDSQDLEVLEYKLSLHIILKNLHTEVNTHDSVISRKMSASGTETASRTRIRRNATVGHGTGVGVGVSASGSPPSAQAMLGSFVNAITTGLDNMGYDDMLNTFQDVVVSLTPEQIPLYTTSLNASDLTEEDRERDCGICSTLVTETESSDTVDLLRLPCNHIFHRGCITRHFTRSVYCPMCRHDVRRQLTD